MDPSCVQVAHLPQSLFSQSVTSADVVDRPIHYRGNECHGTSFAMCPCKRYGNHGARSIEAFDNDNKGNAHLYSDDIGPLLICCPICQDAEHVKVTQADAQQDAVDILQRSY